MHPPTSYAAGRAFLIMVFLATMALPAADWPAYRHDNQRSGVTAEQLPPSLIQLWQHTPQHPPRPGMAEAAKTDYWHKLSDLAPRTTYDRTFHVVAAGDAVFFGSSADDKVYCLDAASGTVRWSFCAGGPVRLAPACHEGRLYFGSDDGWVYCLNSADGLLVWKRHAAAEDRQIIGHGRLISAGPIRTGVLVDNGTAYVGAGLFPDEAVWLRALNARDGSAVWDQKLAISPQGYLVGSPSHLYVPTGRTSPAIFRRADGQANGAFKGVGGADVLLSEGLLCFGPGNIGEIEAFRTETLELVTTFQAEAMVATPTVIYLQRGRQLRALDRVRHLALLDREQKVRARQKVIAKRLEEIGRSPGDTAAPELRKEFAENQGVLAALPQQFEACVLWRRSCSNRHALILAGQTLYAGGDGQVAAFAAGDGSPAWSGPVNGAAYGLAAAQGRLLISTDRGTIHAFGKPSSASLPASVVPPVARPSTASDWPPAASRQTARQIVEKTGVKKGFCLVLGCGEGRLVGALARLTDLTVVGIEEDVRQQAAARNALDLAGLHGTRVSVQPGPLSALPAGFANLVVCDPERTSVVDTSQVARLLRPYGGVAWLGPAGEPVRRGPPTGAGEWTHLYADAGNTACSGDQLLGAPTRVLWFGEPGPRPMADRHHRAVPPLFKDGRLFIPAYHRVLAMDAYNGTLLWEAELPESTRLGAAKDSGHLALAADLLYAASPTECLALEVASGSIVRRFPTPQRDGGGYTWGYTATAGDQLFGSGRKKNASLRAMGLSVIEIQYGDLQAVSTSAYLFSLDRHDGRLRWLHQGGIIPDPAIALGDGRVYFVECAAPEAVKGSQGRLKLNTLLSGETSLVALSMETGRVLWKQPVDLRAIQHVLFLSSAGQTLLVAGSKNKQGTVWYDLSGFDAATGQPLWHREQNNQTKAGGDHGEQTLHPVIIAGIVYAEPQAYHLRTGQPVADWAFSRQGHGCGTLSGSASQLFYRAGHPAMFDLGSRQARKLSVVSRPGCWINIIPAGGLILVPEASSGCTCGFSIETTIVFAPQPP
jgi:outer membrane protein assembly factor BamB